MQISYDVFFQFLSNYLIAVTFCFIGCFVREAHAASTTRTKITIINIIIDSITSGFFVIALIKLITKYLIIIDFEYYLVICFFIGFWSDGILDAMYNKTLVVKFLQAFLGNLGTAGKAFAEAWKDADIENKKIRDKRTNIKRKNNNDIEKDQ